MGLFSSTEVRSFFGRVLDFLRTGELNGRNLQNWESKQLRKEFEFYRIPFPENSQTPENPEPEIPEEELLPVLAAPRAILRSLTEVEVSWDPLAGASHYIIHVIPAEIPPVKVPSPKNSVRLNLRKDTEFSFRIEVIFGTWDSEISPPSAPVTTLCVGGLGTVKIFGGSTKCIKDIAEGDFVETPEGFREISEVFRFSVFRERGMVSVNGCWFTPGHPIIFLGKWVRADQVGSREKLYVDFVYNFVVKGNGGIIVSDVPVASVGTNCGPEFGNFRKHVERVQLVVGVAI